MKNNKILLVTFLTMLLGISTIFYGKYLDLEDQNKELLNTIENYELEFDIESGKFSPHDCYFCGTEVNVNPVDESFYIKCPKCKIKTTYFDDKVELINYWNSLEERDKEDGK